MGEPLLEVANLVKEYPVRRNLFDLAKGKKGAAVHAVNDVSFTLGAGEVLGLAGESGSGKTVTGEICAGLQSPTSGQIVYGGQRLADPAAMGPEFRRQVQMIFQDPYETLNRSWTVGRTVQEPLLIQRIGRKEHEERTARALEEAGLSPYQRYINKYPHELSGGERQRVSIARALVLDPRLIIADEPTSMLDVSLRSGLILLFERLRNMHGFSMLFISHDLSVLRYVSDRIAIMYLGKIVELGQVDEVISHPLHPYTQALMSVVPTLDNDNRERIILEGEIPNPIDLPTGCAFHTRCPHRMPICTEATPLLGESAPGHQVACFIHSDAESAK